MTPISADFGPGFVFRGRLENGELVFGEIVCQTLYPKVQPRSAAVVLNNDSLSHDLSAELNLSLLDRIFRFLKLGSASLDAKYANKATYTVSLGTVSDSYIPLSDLWSNSKPIEVDSGCHAAIEDLKVKGQFANSVFVVSRALTAQGLSYKFGSESDASGHLVTDVKNAAKVDTSGSLSISESGGNTSVDAKVPLHLCIEVQQVDQWVPSGAVSAAGISTDIINGHPVPGNYVVQEK